MIVVYFVKPGAAEYTERAIEYTLYNDICIDTKYIKCELIFTEIFIYTCTAYIYIYIYSKMYLYIHICIYKYILL